MRGQHPVPMTAATVLSSTRPSSRTAMGLSILARLPPQAPRSRLALRQASMFLPKVPSGEQAPRISSGEQAASCRMGHDELALMKIDVVLTLDSPGAARTLVVSRWRPNAASGDESRSTCAAVGAEDLTPWSRVPSC